MSIIGSSYGRRTGIADTARLFGITTRALRFYEQEGLIESGRDRSNARTYDAGMRARLSWIAPLRAAGVPIAVIREILDADAAGDARPTAYAALRSRLTKLREEQEIVASAITALDGGDADALSARIAPLRQAGAPPLRSAPPRIAERS